MHKQQLFAVLLLALALWGGGAALGTEARPVMRALRVRDGAIVVDGRFDDWPACAFAAPYERVADSLACAQGPLIQAGHGAWLGSDDLSAHVRAAVDSTTLYVSATVRDQLLFNEGNADAPWVGDEFEIFLDANPPAQRFQPGTNENFAQFIFVPEHLWQHTTGTFIWRSAKYPGVVAASRITPLGYTIEVAIPKDVVPYWKAHHELDSIGFDVQIGDIDSPGLIGHDAGPKINMELLQPYPHFNSAAQLSTLQFDPALTTSTPRKARPDHTLPGYEAAQKLLDHFDAPGIERQANAALKHADLARKAALFILSKREELPADTQAIAAILRAPEDKSRGGFTLDARVYALMALAERRQLPAAEALTRYGASDDLVLQQTALWAIGLNGDRSVAPALAKLFPTTTGLTQEIAAISLARLGDKTSVPLLKTIAQRDRGQSFGILSQQLLSALGGDNTPNTAN